jgi:AcrR family transcriptional regulator
MGILERKEKEKADLRRVILNAAREVFLEKGFEQTSIRNIAEKIEYSPTTIYLYFKDKDSIFLELHNEGFQLLGQNMAVLLNVENPFERLKAMGLAYIQFAQEHQVYYDLMFVQTSPMDCLDEKPWEQGSDAFSILKITIQQCMDQGYLNFESAEIGAYVVWSTMHGMCILNFRNRCQVISEENREEIILKGYREFIRLLTK